MEAKIYLYPVVQIEILMVSSWIKHAFYLSAVFLGNPALKEDKFRCINKKQKAD